MVFDSSNCEINESGCNIWYQSRSDPGRLEIYDALKKNEILLMEEKIQRETGERRIHSRLEGLEQKVLELQASMEKTQAKFQSLADQMHGYNKHKSVMGEGLFPEADRVSSSTLRNPIPPYQSQNTERTYSSFCKIEFPSFDGDSPRVWVKKCRSYFQEVSISEEYKIPLASVYFCGKADLWYRSLSEEKMNVSWEEFISAVLERFDDVKLVHDESDEIFVKEAEIGLETQVFDEIFVSEIEELTTVEMGIKAHESEELEEKDTIVDVGKPMSEMVVVFCDLPVCEIYKLVSTEIVANMWGINEIQEARGYNEGEFLSNCSFVSGAYFIIDPGGNGGHAAKTNMQEGQYLIGGNFFLYYSGKVRIYFVIDPGGGITYKLVLQLVQCFSFEISLENLDDWHFDCSKIWCIILLGNTVDIEITRVLVEGPKSKKNARASLPFSMICSIVGKAKRAAHYKWGASGFIILIPWQIDKSFGICMCEFQENSQDPIGINFCKCSDSLNSLIAKWKITGYFWIFDLMGMGMNSLKWQLWTIYQFARWIFVCFRRLNNQVYVGDVNFIYLVGLISLDEMPKKEAVKLLKLSVEIFHFQFTQVLENLDYGVNWMRDHMIRLVQSLNLKPSLLESYLVFKESTKSTRKSVSLLCNNLNNFLNKGFLKLRYFISLLICNGKGGKSVVKLELGESIVKKWDLVVNLYSLVKIFRCYVLKIGEGFVDGSMIHDCLTRECCRVVQGWGHRFFVNELKHALKIHLAHVIQQFYTEMQEILDR